MYEFITYQMKFSIIVSFIFLFFGLTKANSQSNSLTLYKTSFEKELKSWTLSFNNFKLSKFERTDTLKFETITFNNIKEINKFYKLYKAALTFSRDSSLFIDIYSYWLNLQKRNGKVVSNAEVDQAVLFFKEKRIYLI